MRMKLEVIENWLTITLLAVSGLIGVVIGLSDTFGLEHPFIEKHSNDVLVSIVGLIALSLGLERAIHQRKLDSHLEYIAKLLASQVGGRLLRGIPEIYSATIYPVSQAKRSLRAVIYGKAIKAPPEFADAVSRRLSETKASGNPIYYEVIFASHIDDPNTFCEGIEHRLKTYKSKCVDDQVQLRIFECDDRVGFDMLIIDEEHVFIAFPVIHNHVDVQNSIFFQNQPELCRELASWFEHRIKPASQEYWQWKKTAFPAKSI
jgi:hypothetical protein